MKINTFHKTNFKMLSAKCETFYVGLSVLRESTQLGFEEIQSNLAVIWSSMICYITCTTMTKMPCWQRPLDRARGAFYEYFVGHTMMRIDWISRILEAVITNARGMLCCGKIFCWNSPVYWFFNTTEMWSLMSWRIVADIKFLSGCHPWKIMFILKNVERYDKFSMKCFFYMSINFTPANSGTCQMPYHANTL